MGAADEEGWGCDGLEEVSGRGSEMPSKTSSALDARCGAGSSEMTTLGKPKFSGSTSLKAPRMPLVLGGKRDCGEGGGSTNEVGMSDVDGMTSVSYDGTKCDDGGSPTLDVEDTLRKVFVFTLAGDRRGDLRGELIFTLDLRGDLREGIVDSRGIKSGSEDNVGTSGAVGAVSGSGGVEWTPQERFSSRNFIRSAYSVLVRGHNVVRETACYLEICSLFTQSCNSLCKGCLLRFDLGQFLIQTFFLFVSVEQRLRLCFVCRRFLCFLYSMSTHRE